MIALSMRANELRDAGRGREKVKSFESGPFQVGQKLLYCSGTKIQTVTFVSLGPRMAKGGNGARDTILGPPQTAIVRDRSDSLLTVNLSDLKPLPPK